MSSIASTNVRVGPGVYLALKQLSDNSKMSMGAWANFLIVMSFYQMDKDQKIIKSFPLRTTAMWYHVFTSRPGLALPVASIVKVVAT